MVHVNMGKFKLVRMGGELIHPTPDTRHNWLEFGRDENKLKQKEKKRKTNRDNRINKWTLDSQKGSKKKGQGFCSQEAKRELRVR